MRKCTLQAGANFTSFDGAGVLSAQLAALESSLHSAVLQLADLIHQSREPDAQHSMTMTTLRLKTQVSVAFTPNLLGCVSADA